MKGMGGGVGWNPRGLRNTLRVAKFVFRRGGAIRDVRKKHVTMRDEYFFVFNVGTIFHFET